MLPSYSGSYENPELKSTHGKYWSLGSNLLKIFQLPSSGISVHLSFLFIDLKSATSLACTSVLPCFSTKKPQLRCSIFLLASLPPPCETAPSWLPAPCTETPRWVSWAYKLVYLHDLLPNQFLLEESSVYPLLLDSP